MKDGSNIMKAELGVGFKLFEEKYMSKVTCHQPHSVQVSPWFDGREKHSMLL